MTQKTTRLASYKKTNKQIVVALDADLRTKFDGKTLGEMLATLKITDDEAVSFGYWENALGVNVASIIAKKDDVNYFFNVSGSLTELIEASEFEGDLLDCQGRTYLYDRPLMENVRNADGKTERKEKKDADGKTVMEEVTGFNIGKPQGYRKIEDAKSLFEGEMTADDAAALLASGGTQ